MKDGEILFDLRLPKIENMLSLLHLNRLGSYYSQMDLRHLC